MTTAHNAQPARDNTPATNPRDIPRPHPGPAAFPVLTPNPRSLDHHHATTGSAQAAAHHHDTQHCQHHSSDHHTAAQQRDHDDHSSQHQPSRPAPQTTDTQRDQHAAQPLRCTPRALNCIESTRSRSMNNIILAFDLDQHHRFDQVDGDRTENQTKPRPDKREGYAGTP